MNSNDLIISRIQEIYCAKGLKEEKKNIFGFKSMKAVQSLEEIGRDELFNYHLEESCRDNRHNGIISRPCKRASVLVIGNHSAGKSSFINWYIGEKIQSTGIAIETSHFTMVTHGDKSSELHTEGTLTMYPFLKEIMNRSRKETYGTFFTNLNTKISVKKEKNFEKIDFVDTPGLTDGYVRYNCDIIEMMKWMSEFVDLVLVFLDPIGQALCTKTMQMIEYLSEKYPNKIKICLSKIDQIESEEDFTKLNLQIHSAITSNTKNMNIEVIPFTVVKDYNRPNNKIKAIAEAIENTSKSKSLRNIEILTNDCYFIQSHIALLKEINRKVKTKALFLRVLFILMGLVAVALIAECVLCAIDFSPRLSWSVEIKAIVLLVALLVLAVSDWLKPKVLTSNQLEKLGQWETYCFKALEGAQEMTSEYFSSTQ